MLTPIGGCDMFACLFAMSQTVIPFSFGEIDIWLQKSAPLFNIVSFSTLADSSQGIVAGVPFFDEVFKQLDCT